MLDVDFSWEITYELATFGTPVLSTNRSKIPKNDFFYYKFFLGYSVYNSDHSSGIDTSWFQVVAQRASNFR